MLTNGNSNMNGGSGDTRSGQDRFSYSNDQPRTGKSELKQIYRTPQLNYGRANYSNLIQVVDYVRTSLKALWIPTPRFASRFAVFGKLSEMPVENHKVIGEDADYIDLDITVDESL